MQLYIIFLNRPTFTFQVQKPLVLRNSQWNLVFISGSLY